MKKISMLVIFWHNIGQFFIYFKLNRKPKVNQIILTESVFFLVFFVLNHKIDYTTKKSIKNA